MRQRRSRNRNREYRDKTTENRVKTYPYSWYTVFRLDNFLNDRLPAAGFPPVGIAQRMLIKKLLNKLKGKWVPTIDELKMQIAPVLCKSEEEQQRFYRTFTEYVESFKPIIERPDSPQTVPSRKYAPYRSNPFRGQHRGPRSFQGNKTYIPDIPLTDTPVPAVRIKDAGDVPPPRRIETTRKGPIAFELLFNGEEERCWAGANLETEIRPLREMEVTAVQEWDIPQSIRRTIKHGGFPTFVHRLRRKSPQYLLLIEQKSSRDHLAAYYAELVAELQALDMDADYYFFDQSPLWCWKERRRPGSYTTLDRLHQGMGHSKLMIIADAENLTGTHSPKTVARQSAAAGETEIHDLETADVHPSELILKICKDWESVALLNSKSTADWSVHEEVLCHVLPVTPASVAGLGTLVKQWQSNISYTPYFWRIHHPEPPTPEPAADLSDTEGLEFYLGQTGFDLLCACAIYPEIYWKLTKSFKDIVLPADDAVDTQTREELWNLTLLSLSQLQWFRNGRMPAQARKILREKLDKNKRKAVNSLLSGMLRRESLPEGSYAQIERDYTIALLDFENYLLDAPDARQKISRTFINDLESRGISVQDISDAVGREIYRDVKEAVLNPRKPQSGKTPGLAIEDLDEGYVQAARASLKTGLADLQKEKLDSARQNLQFALSRFEDLQDLIGKLESLNALAKLEKLSGDPFSASGYLERTLNLYKDKNDLAQLARAYLELARTYRELGNQTNIANLLESAIHLFRQMGDRANQTEAERELADFEAERKNYHYALDLLTRLLEYYRAANDNDSVAEITAKIEEVRAAKTEVEENPGLISLSADNFIKTYTYLDARNQVTWSRIKEAHFMGLPVKGFIQRFVKGGFCVLVDELETFLPASQIDTRIRHDLEQFIGMEFDFMVIKITEYTHNAVLSRRPILEAYITEQRENTLKHLELGQIFEGIVTNITDFGAFARFNGVDGLIHKSQLSWGRKTPYETVQVDQPIRVKVINFDDAKKRVELSAKELLPHPWDNLPSWIKEGAIVSGVVVQIKDYGAFLEIIEGVEGLLHISQISWRKNILPKDQFEIGQELKVQIVTIDRPKRKMSLSLLYLLQAELENLKANIGSVYEAEVTNMTNYGIFVRLDSGLVGMVHENDFSWNKIFTKPNKHVSVGDRIRVRLMDVDMDKRQISFSIKELEEDPWPVLRKKYAIGSNYLATMEYLPPKGNVVIVSLPDGTEAVGPKTHFEDESKQVFPVGTKIIVKIIDFDEKRRRLMVSHKNYLKGG